MCQDCDERTLSRDVHWLSWAPAARRSWPVCQGAARACAPCVSSPPVPAAHSYNHRPPFCSTVTRGSHLVLPFKTGCSLNISGVFIKLFQGTYSPMKGWPPYACLLAEPLPQPIPGALLSDTLSTYPLRLLTRLSWFVVRGHTWGRVVLHGGGELNGACSWQGEFQQWIAGMNKKGEKS